MTIGQYKAALTPELINTIFAGNTISSASGKWYITVDGKILMTNNGRIFFDSRSQASKAFYNAYRWRANWRIHQFLHEDGYSWSSDGRPGRRWAAFKQVLQEGHNFKIQRYGEQ